MQQGIRFAILTASDKGAAGEREDKSAIAIREAVAGVGEVVDYALLPDEQAAIEAKLREWADQGIADVVLTTGGTGLSPRDVTPEATLAVAERMVNGISEAVRARSMAVTERAMLSRAVAVTRKRTLIINLPGSPKGVRECIEVFIGVLPHAVETLTGKGGECAR